MLRVYIYSFPRKGLAFSFLERTVASLGVCVLPGAAQPALLLAGAFWPRLHLFPRRSPPPPRLPHDVWETHAAYLKEFVTLRSSCQALASSKRAHFLPGQGQPYLQPINNPVSSVLSCLLAFPPPVWAWTSHTAPWLPFIPHPALPAPGSSSTFYPVFLPMPAPLASLSREANCLQVTVGWRNPPGSRVGHQVPACFSLPGSMVQK